MTRKACNRIIFIYFSLHKVLKMILNIYSDPDIGREAGLILDKSLVTSLVWRKADIHRQITIHTQIDTYRQIKVFNLPHPNLHVLVLWGEARGNPHRNK